jgi:hypothetical protein
MLKITGTTVEEAVQNYERMRLYKPFEYSGIRYIRQYDIGFWKLYVHKPKNNTYPLYKIN